MAEDPRTTRIRLELTKRQKKQLRKATGRDVQALELRLRGLPEPDEGQEEASDADVPERG
jgi:hypothetical protein